MKRPFSTLLHSLGLSDRSRDRESIHDHSPKPSLPSDEGELWVGIKATDDADQDSAVVAALTDHVESVDLGVWTGQSQGGGQSDVSFEVDDLQVAAASVRDWFDTLAPPRDYWISDDYESVFDQLQ